MREVKKGNSSTLKQIILSIKTSNINKAFSAITGLEKMEFEMKFILLSHQ